LASNDPTNIHQQQTTVRTQSRNIISNADDRSHQYNPRRRYHLQPPHKQSFGSSCTGNPSRGDGIGSLLKVSSLQHNFHSNRVTTWCIITSVSILASSLPGHIRGPPPNGTKQYGGVGVRLPKRFGLNICGSGKTLGSICVTVAAQNT